MYGRRMYQRSRRVVIFVIVLSSLTFFCSFHLPIKNADRRFGGALKVGIGSAMHGPSKALAETPSPCFLADSGAASPRVGVQSFFAGDLLLVVLSSRPCPNWMGSTFPLWCVQSRRRGPRNAAISLLCGHLQQRSQFNKSRLD